MEKQLPFVCVGFIPEDPKWDGLSAPSCKDCLAWSPIANDRPYILEDRTVNCYNFMEVKKIHITDLSKGGRCHE